jgi:hypothetical protein
MPYERFTKWWQQLKDVVLQPLSKPTYDPNVFLDAPHGQDKKGQAVQNVLGVAYGGVATKSWFSQHDVVL